RTSCWTCGFRRPSSTSRTCWTRPWRSTLPRSWTKPAPSRRSPTVGTRSRTRPERTSSWLRTSRALASRSRPLVVPTPEPGRLDPAPGPLLGQRDRGLAAWRSDGAARWLFIWPAVLLVLALSIFPLLASVAISVSKLVFKPDHVDLSWIGFSNYQQL